MSIVNQKCLVCVLTLGNQLQEHLFFDLAICPASEIPSDTMIKFSSSITSAMTAQRNMYCLAYATNFFTQKQLPSGNFSQPYCLALSALKDQKPTMVNAQSHGLGVISSHSVGFEQFWST